MAGLILLVFQMVYNVSAICEAIATLATKMEILNTVSKQVCINQDRIHGMISVFIKADSLTSIIQR